MAFGIFILISGAENKVDHGENAAGGVIIALGAVILIIAIFGCLAAIHESKRKLIIVRKTKLFFISYFLL